VKSDDDPTLGVTAATVATMPGPRTDSKRFATGAIIAGRYRLVAMLGRGGMGEVYRAEDLTLDQPVALKFLPEAVTGDTSRLTQFHNELRVARQVSHKNVVRLYDLGEADGRPFLTMEYVDGEDLGSLLRRIGRFPQDKALDIARQLCAGVAAAHDRGVVHRDLKPANVMLDGEGNVRITDFGIATAAHDAGAEIAGTPQYMAPEQFTGAAASTATDIYALGLILFEIFTGKRAYEAKTFHELKQLHDTRTLATTPSSIVRDLDPVIERVILRAIDRDPSKRPASALAVAAALPGANPLAEALAAGETPSPELLVAAGEANVLPVWKGITAVTVILVALLALVPFLIKTSFARFQPLDKPPAVLIDRAEQILRSVGYTEPRVDTAFGWGQDAAYVAWIARTDESPNRWSALAKPFPTPLAFWYRTAPRPMMASAIAFAATASDPPIRDSDSHFVELDTQGRLIQLRSVPSQFERDPADAAAPPWHTLFEAAGLTMTNFQPVTPQWTSPDFGDTRTAWEGPHDARADVRIRVEAAAFRGRPVYFVVLGPWNVPTRIATAVPMLQQVLTLIFRLGIIALMMTAVVLARRNTKAGRSDMRGATRFALVLGWILLASQIIGGHHVANTPLEYNALTVAVMTTTWQSLMLWMVYLALEPYGRRFWPDMLLGWSRLLSGHFRDARVGREVLGGVACGIAFVAVHTARLLLPQQLGYPAYRPMMGAGIDTLHGTGLLIGAFLNAFFREVGAALLTTLVFVVCRLITRRQAPAIALGMAILFYYWSSLANASPLWLEIVLEIAAVAVLTIATIRFGLLASACTLFLYEVLERAPMTFDVAHWSATPANLALAIVVSLTLFGYYASRGDQPLFGQPA